MLHALHAAHAACPAAAPGEGAAPGARAQGARRTRPRPPPPQAAAACTTGSARPRLFGTLDSTATALFSITAPDPDNPDGPASTVTLTLRNLVVDGATATPAPDAPGPMFRSAVLAVRGGGVALNNVDLINWWAGGWGGGMGQRGCRERGAMAQGWYYEEGAQMGSASPLLMALEGRSYRSSNSRQRCAALRSALHCARARPARPPARRGPIVAPSPPRAARSQSVDTVGGGAVSVTDTPFSMTGGRIAGCRTPASGGAVLAQAQAGSQLTQ